MNRKVILDCCGSCQFFFNEYPEYEQECLKLNLHIEEAIRDARGNQVFTIPDSCPLPPTKEIATE